MTATFVAALKLGGEGITLRVFPKGGGQQAQGPRSALPFFGALLSDARIGRRPKKKDRNLRCGP